MAKAKAKKSAAKKSAAKPRSKAKGGEAKKASGALDQHTIKLASAAALNGLHKDLTALESESAGVQKGFAEAWKDHKKRNIDKKAVTMARSLLKLSTPRLAVVYAHLLHCFDVMGIEEKATKQLDLFKQAVAKGQTVEADGAIGDAPEPTDGEVKSTKSRKPRGAKSGAEIEAKPGNGGAQAEQAEITEIKRKMEAGEFVSQAERERLADFVPPQAADGAPAAVH